MTKSSFRGGSLAVLVGVLIVAAAAATVAIGWLRSDPATKAGRLRRSLDAVGNETERRDREIEELTGSQVGK
jgi:flagellar basal body-associated protein FliL